MFFLLYILAHAQIEIIAHRRKRLRFKGLLYIFFTGILLELTFGFFFLTEFFGNLFVFSIFVDFIVLLFLFLYLKVGKSYPIKKSLILAMILISIMLMIQYATTSLIAILPLNIDPTFFDYNDNPVITFFIVLGFMLLFSLISLFVTFLTVKYIKSLRSTLNNNKTAQNILLCICLFLIISFQLAIHFTLQTEGTTINLVLINFIFFTCYLIIAFISFSLFASSIKKEYDIKQKKMEQESLQRYTDELESQQTTIRKFKHDYQNILTSIGAYIEEGDLSGLQFYYKEKIEVTSTVIEQDSIIFDNLSKIKVREIKSIFAAKLLLTLDTSLNITTSFESNRDIDYIPIDSIILVRMLGIILDNAVDAVTELGHGVFRVGCFKDETDITIIVQNTCSSNLPPLHKLKQQHFSTKGDGRGLGLSNLQELTNSCPNVMLETEVVGNLFTQKLTILEEVTK
jgi:two-component system sensor histidine kinase AgrC